MMEEHNRRAVEEEEKLTESTSVSWRRETGKPREFRELVRPRGHHKRDRLEKLMGTYCCGGGGRGRRVGRSLCAQR